MKGRFVSRYILVALVLVVATTGAYCQTKPIPDTPVSRVFRADSLFDYYGVIFDSIYDPGIILRNFRRKFTPTPSDVVIAEQVFREQFNKANQADEATKGMPFVKNVKRYFWKYNRQYVGYYDIYGNRSLIVEFIEYRRKRLVGDSWKTSFMIYLAENPRFVTTTYRVDITHEKLYVEF